MSAVRESSRAASNLAASAAAGSGCSAARAVGSLVPEAVTLSVSYRAARGCPLRASVMRVSGVCPSASGVSARRILWARVSKCLARSL